uniref:Uncharacterized protein n=1 Tax=Panagrolaimus superbus TaxID=310955 RepID=A0A914ZBT9_9BILA
MSWGKPLSISVFDVIYNKFITLLPDMNVSELLTRSRFNTDHFHPSILFVNTTTLLILFNDNGNEGFYDTVLLAVVELNFSAAIFSIIDNKIIRDCYSTERLVKSDDRFLIIHTFATDMEEFEYGYQFLGYFTFFLHDDLKIETDGNRIVFDFDYQNSGYLGTWYIWNNKLWCIRNVGRTPDFELISFDLIDTNHKATSIGIFEIESRRDTSGVSME